MTLDDGTFTTEIVMHTGGGAIARYRCAALPDTSFTQTFIRRGVLNHMLLVGAVSSACERPSSPRS